MANHCREWGHKEQNSCCAPACSTASALPHLSLLLLRLQCRFGFLCSHSPSFPNLLSYGKCFKEPSGNTLPAPGRGAAARSWALGWLGSHPPHHGKEQPGHPPPASPSSRGIEPAMGPTSWGWLVWKTSKANWKNWSREDDFMKSYH